jgi:Sulfotransferase family
MSFSQEKLSLYLKMKLMPLAWRFTSPARPEKWIFIVGCYNSGTTLLHKLLAQHPFVGSLPNEGQFFNDVLPYGRQFGLPRLWALKPDLFHLKETAEGYDVDRLKRQWTWFYNHSQRPILIEKTILNMARTRWLQQHFPNSYFIAIYRSGYAVAEGIKRKEGHSLEKGITQWTISNDILLDDLHYIKNKISLKYEDLTAQPFEELKKITDFLEIDELPASVFDKAFSIHHIEGKISNRNESSLEKLDNDEVQLMNKVGGAMFEKLGYPML